MEKNESRSKWLHVRLTAAEHKQINDSCSKTDCGKLSDYARKILLGKPMIGVYRNGSMDDFMTELIKLRTELNSIGNNFNQLVKRLHMTSEIEIIKALLTEYAKDKEQLILKVNDIKLFIEQKAEKW